MKSTDIETRIAELERELKSVEGTPTEIYTRIVGYYRSLNNWNRGKREEYRHRKTFSVAESTEAEPKQRITLMEREQPTQATPVEQAAEGAAGETDQILFFSRQHCPNCPPMKSALQTAGIVPEEVDVDSESGFELARSYEILVTPTVLMINTEGSEVRRVTNPLHLKNELQETA